MILQTIHKHAIIVAAVTILASLTTISFHITMTSSLWDFNSEDTARVLYVSSGVVVFAVLLIVASGLLIFGVVKQRPLLILPWLILSTLSSILIVISAFIIFIHMTSFHYNGIAVFLTVIGLNVIILYPIYGLFMEINKAERKNEIGRCIVTEEDGNSGLTDVI